MNIWHDLDDSRVNEESFIVCIEISKGSKKKYELDKETGLIILDRILYTSTHYPANYGFIPKTYADDNDPLDVLVLCQETLEPMSLVKCRPLGVVKMIDGGDVDEKIISVVENDPFMSNYQSIDDLPNHMIEEMMHFFRVYKQLEGKDTYIEKVEGLDSAKTIIKNCIKAYKKKFKNKK